MNIIIHLFLISSSFDSVAYTHNYQMQLDMIFITNDKYSIIDILSDLNDLKNLDRKIDEKIVEYLNDE